MTEIDFSKPVQTKDGRRVEILGTNGREPLCIYGYIEGNCELFTWTKSGCRWADGSPARVDLEQADNRMVVFVNVYKSATGETWMGYITYPTLDEARKDGLSGRYGEYITTVTAEYEES